MLQHIMQNAEDKHTNKLESKPDVSNIRDDYNLREFISSVIN